MPSPGSGSIWSTSHACTCLSARIASSTDETPAAEPLMVSRQLFRPRLPRLETTLGWGGESRHAPHTYTHRYSPFSSDFQTHTQYKYYMIYLLETMVSNIWPLSSAFLTKYYKPRSNGANSKHSFVMRSSCYYNLNEFTHIQSGIWSHEK